MQEGYGTLACLEERTRYEFDGWYTEAIGGEVTQDTKVTIPITTQYTNTGP